MTDNGVKWSLTKIIFVLVVVLSVVILAMLTGCVTGADLRRIADQVDGVESALEDEEATYSELEEAVAGLRTEIVQVVEEVQARTEDTLTGLSHSQQGGLVGLAGALGVHLYRQHRRKSRGEQV